MLQRWKVCAAMLAVGLCASGRGVASEGYTAELVADQLNSSTVRGVATVMLNADETELAYEIVLVGVDLDGMQTPERGDDVTGLHIRVGVVGERGRVAFGIINPGHDANDLLIDPASGTVNGIWDASDNALKRVGDLLAELRSEEFYVAVSTVAHPGGAIRGQLISSSASPTSPTARSRGTEHVVTASGFTFSPADITIEPGDTVRWELVSGFHTVTEGTDGTIDGDELFHSDLDPDTPVFEFTFSDMSDVVIDYFCAIHFGFGMTGTITILPAECEGDANGDGVVDPLDSGFVLARFGCPVRTGDPGCDDADQNGDGTVDPLDSGFVLARFGDCP